MPNCTSVMNLHLVYNWISTQESLFLLNVMPTEEWGIHLAVMYVWFKQTVLNAWGHRMYAGSLTHQMLTWCEKGVGFCDMILRWNRTTDVTFLWVNLFLHRVMGALCDLHLRKMIQNKLMWYLYYTGYGKQGECSGETKNKWCFPLLWNHNIMAGPLEHTGGVTWYPKQRMWHC